LVKDTSLLCGLLELNELKDTILHLLDSLVFSKTHTALVGDVVDAALGLSVLTSGSADLEVVLAGNLFKLGVVSSQLGDLDVDGGTDGGAQVGGAECEETKPVVVAEGNLGFNLVDATHKTAVDLAEITSHLHGDNPEVILLVAPDKEGLLVVVVDTTAVGPVATGVSGLEKPVSFLEEEVVVDELLLNILGHTGQGVESTLVFTSKLGEGGRNLLFHLFVLGLSQTGVEGIAFHGASASHTGGDNVGTLGINVDEGVNITEVLVGVLISLGETDMVVFNDGIEEGSKEAVGFSIRGIYTYTGVEVLHTRLNDIEEGGTKLGLLGLQLLKNVLGQVFLEQGLAVSGSLKLLEASI